MIEVMIVTKEAHCNFPRTIANKAIGSAVIVMEWAVIAKIIAQPVHDSEHDFVAVIADAMDERRPAVGANVFGNSKENHFSSMVVEWAMWMHHRYQAIRFEIVVWSVFEMVMDFDVHRLPLNWLGLVNQ